jgi:predicted RNase H-like HicB family nuclease
MTQYIALIHKDVGSDFGVSFPDFPGCITAASTLDEAREMAPEALALHLEGLEEDGVEIPAPSSLDEVMTDPENRDGVVMLVPAPDRAERSKRINVMVPVETLERIDSYVAAKGYSRSGFLVDAAEQALSRSRNVALPDKATSPMDRALEALDQANDLLAAMVKTKVKVNAQVKARVRKLQALIPRDRKEARAAARDSARRARRA